MMSDQPSPIDERKIASTIREADPRSAEKLLPLVYAELRRLAAHRLAQERPGQTLQATALVHEAYLRLVGDTQHNWDNRAHFFAAAATAMRRILISKARERGAQKRGANAVRVNLNEADLSLDTPSDELIALDEALRKLEQIDPLRSQVVELRYFGGLKMAEAANVLDISLRTANRYWDHARAWLRRELESKR